ncbi:MAG: hypothetical protein NTY71_00165 [Methanoregula sp.]|nr:hypothetical protein [Methanoregula sp.]
MLQRAPAPHKGQLPGSSPSGGGRRNAPVEEMSPGCRRVPVSGCNELPLI